DEKGEFVIRNVPVGIQRFSARVVGYRGGSAEMEVKGGTTTRIVIRIGKSSTMLSEVITTASGQQKRLEVGNDITVINVDSVMRVAPISSVTDLLDTRVPGLMVQ